jgi:hypothetical protein
MRKSAQTKSVKPHILSWLQRDPAAGVKPFVFTPNLSGKANKPHRSHLITRACLASTTSEFLLVDRAGNGIAGSRFLRAFARLFPFRLFLVAGVVCMTWPTANTVALGQPRPPEEVRFEPAAVLKPGLSK